MPFQTAMQQALAAGPGAKKGTTAQTWSGDMSGGGPLVGQSPMPAPQQPTNPYSLGDAFAAHYGGKPTHQIVSAQQAGQDVVPNSAAQGNLSVGGQQAPVTATPEQAGQMNALAPGTFNGNPANGTPSADEGFSKALAAGPPSPPPASPAQPKPAPSFADQNTGTGNDEAIKHRAALAGVPVPQPAPTPAPVPPVASPALEPSGTTQPSGPPSLATAYAKAAKAKTPTAGVSPAYEPLQDASTATNPPPANQSIISQGNGPSAAVTGGPANGKAGGQTGIAQAPPSDVSAMGSGMGDEKKASNGTGNAQQFWGNGSMDDITSVIEGTGPHSKDWNTTFWTQGIGLNAGQIQQSGLTPLPNVNSRVWRNVNVDSPESLTSALNVSSAQGIQDPSVARMLAWGSKRVEDFYANQQNEGGTAYTPQQQASMMRDIAIVQTALKQYGVTWDPYKTAGVGIDGQPSTKPPGGEFSGYDESGQYHLSTQNPAYNRYTKDDVARALGHVGGKDLTPEQYLAGVEYLNQQHLVERGMGAQDAAYQNASKTMADNLADPSLTRYNDLAASIAKNPDPTDWEAVKNQYVANADRVTRDDAAAISSSFGRRGLGPTSAAGVTADTLRKAAGDKAMGLGDLTIQQSKAKRQGELQAAGLAQTGVQLNTGIRSGGDAARNQILMGEAPTTANPTAGVTNAALNLHATQISLDQLNKAGDTSSSQGIAGYASAFASLAALFI